jgi:hypothetical protein
MTSKMHDTSMRPKENGVKKINIRKLKFSVIRILKDGKERKEFPSRTWTSERLNHHYASPERR